MVGSYLSSGLFLGWSLGANDASNVFGTAVGAKMIRFRTAAIYCSVFLILGAVVSGAGVSHTLGKLGAINAVAGAFVVAFSAALTVYLMTVASYPVSTSQAIVGAIIGWNFFTGSLTDYGSLIKIVATWVVCPALAAALAIFFYKIITFLIRFTRMHMFKLDMTTRYGLIITGIFGSYSLGANNIANVMGVFVPVAPFPDVVLFKTFTISATQQLFFIGGLAIAVGVFTYSKRVMMTVGSGIMALSPVASFVSVLSHSVVLFIFASQGLESLLMDLGLPTIPLVPVSSSQAIVGSVVGIGLLKGGRTIRWRTVGGIAVGWVTTPVVAGLVCYIGLFIFQNVFQQKIHQPVSYLITQKALEKIEKAKVPKNSLRGLSQQTFSTAQRFKNALTSHLSFNLTPETLAVIMNSAELNEMVVDENVLAKMGPEMLPRERKEALTKMVGKKFSHKWQLAQALAEVFPTWREIENDATYNGELEKDLKTLYRLFRRETE